MGWAAGSRSVSYEEDASEGHDIEPDGYDIGRYVERRTARPRPPANERTYRDDLVSGALGTTSYGGVTYSTTAENITGLLAAGSAGINHGELLLNTSTCWD